MLILISLACFSSEVLGWASPLFTLGDDFQLTAPTGDKPLRLWHMHKELRFKAKLE